MTLETEMSQNVYPGSLWLLQSLALLLQLGPADVQAAVLPKAVVKLEPPWINVLQEDLVTLTCWGAHAPEDYRTQWFYNGNSLPTQAQPSYRFKAMQNDSGEYRCQTGQTSLSDPVHLDVFSDWLLLQTPHLEFQEGESITLRCHSPLLTNALADLYFFLPTANCANLKTAATVKPLPCQISDIRTRQLEGTSNDYETDDGIGKPEGTSNDYEIADAGYMTLKHGAPTDDNNIYLTLP
ncbi:low affinity immunoglobulin gamma Fc region receptor II-a [Otolemur garnettii]|uniref:low affinity immunoglobulin gamma Fc region receptor II-a n=1 Tax=Otolemur garnettii TaxID=30611 RepID=UPI000C7F3448|nr:low affinity immunoglobulin gamma Fc region receptor II-a [Otolemur garnettii]